MKEHYNVILWGASYDYDRYCQVIELEKHKKHICIEAVILAEENFAKQIDGIPVADVGILKEADYDYVIVLTKDIWEFVLQIGNVWRIPREKFVFAGVFTIPLFDFVRWVRVRESKVSILSNHCWGGMTYESLQMPFYSPFVGMYESDEDFLKIAGNLTHYLNQPLECVEWITYKDKEYPVVKCDDVILYMNHQFGLWEEICDKWNRRKARLQKDNICVQMHVYEEKYLERFLELPYEKKIAFTTIPCDHEQVIYMDESYLQQKYGESIFTATTQQAGIGRTEFTRYDILGLLLGEEGYKRL